MGKKNHKKKQEPDIEMPEMSKKPNKRLVAIILAAGMALTCGGIYVGSRLYTPNEPKKVESTLEKLTFEAARKAVLENSPDEEEIVQNYLNQLFKDKEKYDLDIDGWDSFRSFIYDPGFKKMYAGYASRGLTPEASNPKYQDTSRGSLMISTPMWETGVKLDVYFSRNIMKFCETQDELLSGLDNEAFHAGMTHTGKIHLSPNVSMKWDKESLGIMIELFSFDLQFKGINYGLRKVRNEYIGGACASARVLFRELEKICEENTFRSRNAKAVYNCLLEQPTFQFFVAKEERASKRPYKLD